MAATKHLRDAEALHEAGRLDGCAYLAGYVVECSLKAVLLHDRSWDPTVGPNGQHVAAKLAAVHMQLRKAPYGHDLVHLASQQLGAEGAKYWPDLTPGNVTQGVHLRAVLDWKETLRYRGEDPQTDRAALRASSYLGWAAEVHARAIVEMRLDGVL
jgi:hypothetical protein